MPAVPLMIAMSPTGELCCSSRCCALLVLLPRGATHCYCCVSGHLQSIPVGRNPVQLHSPA